MIHYRSLGFVNSRVMFAVAVRVGFAVPVYNFNNMEQLQAITLACLETQSPVIIQVSKGARDYADRTLLGHMAHGAVEMMKPEEFDPRKYLGPAREALREMYARKNQEVLGSAGRAPEIMKRLGGELLSF